MRFSKLTQCFYPSDIAYSTFPSDIVDVVQADFDLAQTRPSGATLDLVNGAVVIVPAPALTLVQIKTAQIAAINSSCQNTLAAIITPYPPAEVNTWAMQYSEAVAYTASNAAPTPTLSAIVAAAVAAGGTGYTVASQAASVLAKAAAYTAASGAAIGERQALTDKINAAATIPAAQAVVW